MIEDRDRVRDASQEVWIEVLRSLPGYRGEAKLSTWITVIARRTINRWMAGEWQSDFRTFGRDCRETTLAPPVEELGRPDPERRDIWTRMVCDICLTAILHCLEPGTRFIFILRSILKLDYSDIAGIMEMEEPAVRQRFSRACRKLRNFGKTSCALIDPDGSCRCGHREFLAETTLAEEFRRLRKTANRLETWLNAETVFSRT
jgi:RNA polymerase sigma-70 factor (ECF subfamily)